jgi:hypothetical protein
MMRATTTPRRTLATAGIMSGYPSILAASLPLGSGSEVPEIGQMFSTRKTAICPAPHASALAGIHQTARVLAFRKASH